MNLTILALTAAAFVANSPAAPVLEVQVPFGCGHTFPVSQAHNVGSHLQNDTWAWDFRMPEGTPVTSAADGVVRMARGDSTVGGCDAKYAKFSNYVVVSHADGVETQYLHFSQVTVKPGDKVKAGDLLGYSGNTGWSCGAHLHFKVAKAVRSGWNNPSVPARIAGYGDPQVDTLITAPACRGPEVLIAKGEAKEPATVETAAATATAEAAILPAVVPAVAAPGAENLPAGSVDTAEAPLVDPSALGGSGDRARRAAK